MTENLRQFCLPPDAALRQALACLNDNRRGIVLVTDPERRLLGAITDGDLRRAFLEGLDLDQPVARVRATKQSSPYSKPVTPRRAKPWPAFPSSRTGWTSASRAIISGPSAITRTGGFEA